MGLYSHYGLLVMLLFHLCHAQDVALPSPDPEPAPPSLGDVTDAVKAAFEQAVQISTDGSIREDFEQVVEELTPLKTPAEQSPAAENMTDHTTEEAAVVQASEEVSAVLTAGEPEVNVSESTEQIDEESVQEQAQEAGLTQDTVEEPAGLIQGLTAQEPFQEPLVSEVLVLEPELVLEAAESVQGQAESVVESVLQGPEIVEEGDIQPAEGTNSEESPVQEFTAATLKENEARRQAVEINEPGDVEEEAQVQKPQLSEVEKKTAEGEIEEVEGIIDGDELKGPQVEEPAQSEPSPEKRPAVAAEDGSDGGVLVETEEVEWEKQEQGAADFGGGVIEAEAGREKVEAGTEAQLQKIFRKVEVIPTDKTELVEMQKKPEVNMDTKGPVKLQEPVISKSKATSVGRTHEASDVNEMIASRDQNDQGEPAMRSTVEEPPPTPILGLGLDGTHDDSTQSKVLGQEVWKIGAIAAVFFLILQTAVTILYILKCRRKTNRNAVDDLPEYSHVQQEDAAMTTIPLDSTEKNSSHDLITSVV